MILTLTILPINASSPTKWTNLLCQKALALSIGTSSYQENKEKYEKLKDLYENHPLLINYKVYEEEIHHLLKEIENSLK